MDRQCSSCGGFCKKSGCERENIYYSGNGTAGREADVRPTGFFFQMPKSVGEVYGWHGTGKGQPMCRFNASEAEMPVGTKLYTTPPQRKPLMDEEIIELANSQGWNVQVADLPANLLRMRVRDLGRAIEAAHGIKETT